MFTEDEYVQVIWQCRQKCFAVFGVDVPDWDGFTIALNSRKYRNVGRMTYPHAGNPDYELELATRYFDAIDELAGRKAALGVLREVVIHEFAHAIAHLREYPSGHNRYFRYIMRRLGYPGTSTVGYELRSGVYYVPGTYVKHSDVHARASS